MELDLIPEIPTGLSPHPRPAWASVLWRKDPSAAGGTTAPNIQGSFIGQPPDQPFLQMPPAPALPSFTPWYPGRPLSMIFKAHIVKWLFRKHNLLIRTGQGHPFMRTF